MVKESEEAVSEFISEYELVNVNDHKSIFMCNCSGMEAREYSSVILKMMILLSVSFGGIFRKLIKF